MSKSRAACKAHQVSDQMNCHACGLVWDMNDPDPPECLPEKVRGTDTPDPPECAFDQDVAHENLDKIKGILK
jgi:rubredoxin